MKQRSQKQSAGTTASISNLVERSPADLRLWPGNPRTHNVKQLAKLKASIQKFGFTVPALVDETGTILSGHGRAQAARELGLKVIPVRIICGLTEAQKRAYVIADNKLAQLSGWHTPP
jgi:ParB-like chromosome segregation protein Spo0J